MNTGKHNDFADDRIGEWMHTSTGNRFFPLDPRPGDFTIGDLANGMALDCRYGGQGRVDRFYSVAEHCVHLAQHVLRFPETWHRPGYNFCVPRAALALLLHDAAEAFLNDLPRAVKHSVGDGYSTLEDKLQRVIFAKYNVLQTSIFFRDAMKDLDCRIVPLEKAAIMRYPQPWAYDIFAPLQGVRVECWSPVEAKARFLQLYRQLCKQLHLPEEEWEI